MLTILEVLKRTTEFLDKHGVESARLNAEHLLGHALGLPRMQLYLQFERPLTEAELERVRPLVKRRSGHEPLQYVLGETEFCGLKLKVDRRALIPRPETEMLIELIKEQVATPPAAVLDLGTGSGAIALALATAYPTAAITAVDRSDEALALAGENAALVGCSARVCLLRSDWCSQLDPAAKFELIAANPPYLSRTEFEATAPEVKNHEPPSALVAGADGRQDLAAILDQARRHLAPGGLLACETGETQHAALRQLATDLGYGRTESRQDLAGRDRFLLAFV
ncbi:MAG TPA: peptide chain release factor N(5)-glutamine methyltransferase [Lacunisphaera sp.]|jgi:release factor glutamine methyltransferase|nr:peptide chain release factor N(5)-glutamine methyltransferase [Lacunisphaera sp.]